MSGAKGSKAPPVDLYAVNFCDTCIFNLKVDNLVAGFQVKNGEILDVEQITDTPDEVAACDNCKCSGLSADHVVANIEGECDQERTVDVLEFTGLVPAPETIEGQFEIICPDVTYTIDAECDAYGISLVTGGRGQPFDADIDYEFRGPIATIEVPGLVWVDCTVTCTNPNPPPPIPPLNPKSKGSKAPEPFYLDYDPFEDFFPPL